MTPKLTPAERAAARAREARTTNEYAGAKGDQPIAAPVSASEAGQPGPQPELSHWLVYKPGIRDPFEVTVYPPQTQRDMTTIVYPGCGCVPRESRL